MVSRLLILNGPGKGMSVSLEPGKPLTIGRNPQCDLQFVEKRISNYHCRVFAKEDGYYIEDSGSTNGTNVGTKMISAPYKLKDMDEIRLGSIQLQFISKDKVPKVSDTARIHNENIKTEILSSNLGEKQVGEYKILRKLGDGGTSEILKQNISFQESWWL